jgi:hypothetical protein
MFPIYTRYAAALAAWFLACGSKALDHLLCIDFGAPRQNRCALIEKYHSAEG